MNLRIFQFLFLGLIIITSCNSHSQNHEQIQELIKNPFPAYKDVYEKFNSTYSVRSLSKNQRYVFQKRPKGWYVAKEIDFKSVVDTQLFWSAKEKTYRNLSMRMLNVEEKNAQEKISYNEWNDDYDKSIYYGYKGWNTDVIQFLENEKELPDNFLNSLARAYSNKGSSFLNPHYEFQSDIKIDYDRSYNPKDISNTQVDSFSYYTKMAIDTYKRIIDQNPSYETRVGNIWTKYCNELLYAYTELSFVQQHEAAKEFLKEDLYNEGFIAVASNLLNSCEKNAVLFVGGDNDTYPLLYAQEKLNIRKDVTVINTSLANVGRYIYYLTDVYNGNKIKLTLGKKNYLNDVNDYIGLDNTFHSLYGNNLLTYISQGKHKTEYPGYYSLPGNRISLSTNGFTPDLTNYPEPTYSIPDSTIQIQFNSNHIEKRDLFLLDLLITNQWKRPIYFSSTMGEDFNQPYKSYLSLEGLCYHLIPMQGTTITPTNLPISYSYIKNKFSFKGIVPNDKETKHLDLFIDLYISNLIELANAYWETDKAKALEIGELVYTKFIPVKTSPYYVDLAAMYYKEGQKEKGYKILQQVYNEYKNQFDPAYKKFNKDRSSATREERIALFSYQKLRDICKEFDEKRMSNELEKYQAKDMF